MTQPLPDPVAIQRQRRRSRRGVLADTSTLMLGGAFGLVAGHTVTRRPGAASAQDALVANDLDILNVALTLEHLEHAFYRDGLDAFGPEALADADPTADAFTLLTEIRDHERAHVAFLTEVITAAGGLPVAEATYDFGYDDVAGFLEIAAALENTGVAAYAGAGPLIQNPEILAVALGIHSVEARHAAYLNARIPRSPFPDAFDLALTADEALAIAGAFTRADEPTATQPNGAEAEVNIQTFQFQPRELTVAVGATVTWTNREIIPHTATADDGSFDSGRLGLDEQFSHTFTTPGAYPYYCVPHANMRGLITVV